MTTLPRYVITSYSIHYTKYTIPLAIQFEESPQEYQQPLIGFLPCARFPFVPGVIAGTGNLQHFAHQTDPELLGMTLNETVSHLLSLLKKTTAFFKMSRSSRRRMFSRRRRRSSSSLLFKLPLPGKAASPCSRITSYNVCYTKLLRLFH